MRNVEKHRESHWETVTDMRPGTPDANGIPGPPTPSTRTELRTRTYYTFEMLEWSHSAAPRASGTDQDGVAWPEYKLAPGERVREKKETYSATFSTGDKQYEATFPEQDWRELKVGGSVHLTLGLFGRLKKIVPD